jgi:hypothetical protein
MNTFNKNLIVLLKGLNIKQADVAKILFCNRSKISRGLKCGFSNEDEESIASAIITLLKDETPKQTRAKEIVKCDKWDESSLLSAMRKSECENKPTVVCGGLGFLEHDTDYAPDDRSAKKKYEYYLELFGSIEDYLDTTLFSKDEHFGMKVTYRTEFYAGNIRINTGDGFYSKISFFTDKKALSDELHLKPKRKTIFCEDITEISSSAKKALFVCDVSLDLFQVCIKVNDEEQNEVRVSVDDEGVHFFLDNQELLKMAEVKSFEISFVIPRLINSEQYPIALTAPACETTVKIKYNPLIFSMCRTYPMGIGIQTYSVPNCVDVEYPEEPQKISSTQYEIAYRCKYKDINTLIKAREHRTDLPKFDVLIQHKNATPLGG